MEEYYRLRETNTGLINSKLENTIEVPEELSEDHSEDRFSFSQKQTWKQSSKLDLHSKNSLNLTNFDPGYNDKQYQSKLSAAEGCFDCRLELLKDFPRKASMPKGLRELNISSNFICSLETHSARECLKVFGQTIRKLDLSFNLLSAIPAYFCSYMVSLEYLDVSNNLLASVHQLTQSKIRHLHCHKNLIDSLPVGLYEMTALAEFRFDWPGLILPQVDRAMLVSTDQKHTRPVIDLLKLMEKCKNSRYSYTLEQFFEDFQPKESSRSPSQTLLRAFIEDQSLLSLQLLLRANRSLLTPENLWAKLRGPLEIALSGNANRSAICILSQLPEQQSRLG